MIKKVFVCAAVSWLIFVVVPSSPTARVWLATPLVVSEESAHGDACYVLSGGAAIWERLAAAADLYQAQRIHRIFLMRNNMVAPFSFKANASWTQSQWELDYLVWRGVPITAITIIGQKKGMFGTLTEAKNVTNHLPKDVKALVVVSSPAHMRRSMLAFKRSLPSEVKVTPYAATCFENSVEMYSPIWIEYLKLLVYCLVA